MTFTDEYSKILYTIYAEKDDDEDERDEDEAEENEQDEEDDEVLLLKLYNSRQMHATR